MGRIRISKRMLLGPAISGVIDNAVEAVQTAQSQIAAARKMGMGGTWLADPAHVAQMRAMEQAQKDAERTVMKAIADAATVVSMRKKTYDSYKDRVRLAQRSLKQAKTRLRDAEKAGKVPVDVRLAVTRTENLVESLKTGEANAKREWDNARSASREVEHELGVARKVTRKEITAIAARKTYKAITGKK